MVKLEMCCFAGILIIIGIGVSLGVAVGIVMLFGIAVCVCRYVPTLFSLIILANVRLRHQKCFIKLIFS